VGIVLVMLNATVVFAPIPLSNVVPAELIAVISLSLGGWARALYQLGGRPRRVMRRDRDGVGVVVGTKCVIGLPVTQRGRPECGHHGWGMGYGSSVIGICLTMLACSIE